MNKKTLIAVLAATTLNAQAGFNITGDYQGTISDGNPGAATYAQDLDLKMVGTTEGAKVTATFENLTGGSAVSATQVFIETDLEGLSFKGGNYKGQNGSGLLQTTSAVTNQMEVGFDVAGFDLSVGQESGVGKATVDTSVAFGRESAGVDVELQNVTASDRFITVVANFFGFGVTAETQNTVTGRNTAAAIDTTVAGVDLTTVMIDVNDATALTQDDGILGDISDTLNGNTTKGMVASTATVAGVVTGKYIDKNDLVTYVAEVERGALTVGYSKTENVDAVISGEINVKF